MQQNLQDKDKKIRRQIDLSLSERKCLIPFSIELKM